MIHDPINKHMAQLGDYLTVLVTGIVVLIFGVLVLHHGAGILVLMFMTLLIYLLGLAYLIVLVYLIYRTMMIQNLPFLILSALSVLYSVLWFAAIQQGVVYSELLVSLLGLCSVAYALVCIVMAILGLKQIKQ